MGKVSPASFAAKRGKTHTHPEQSNESQKYLRRCAFALFLPPAAPAHHAAPPSLMAAAAEAERVAALLREITGEGGFAFVASAEKAGAGDLRAAEAAREMAWEQLHSGPWSEVGTAWRDAYALACLHVAGLRAAAGDRSAALRALDMGLIMGGGLLRAELDDAIAGLGRGEAAAVPVADGDVQRWEEGIARGRDLADVSTPISWPVAVLRSRIRFCRLRCANVVLRTVISGFTNGVIGLDCSVSVRSCLVVSSCSISHLILS